ncbi:MAG: hypothetical protein K6L80_01180 [Agarilytica sp.]
MSRSYATILQRLCQDYANHKLNFDEYRNRRRLLLVKIDEQFNGKQDDTEGELTSPGLPSDAFGIASFSPPDITRKPRH